MKYKLTYFGNPILRKKSEPVEEITPEIKELVQEMVELMHQYRGVGFAANQAGENKRIFVTKIPKELENGTYEEGDILIFINPRLFNPSKETEMREEGCLSIPGIWCPIERPLSISVEALDLEGTPFTAHYTGYQARCVMHENDHINGILMIDRTELQVKRQMEQRLRELKKKYKKL